MIKGRDDKGPNDMGAQQSTKAASAPRKINIEKQMLSDSLRPCEVQPTRLL